MIVGSVYLGKKAQKAYRKRQAEKAAQKLAAPFDIVDPSDEIQPNVPPSSPTGRNLNTTHLSIVPSESLSKLASRTSASNLSLSTSTTSQPKSSEEQEYNHYVQRHSGAEEPPSYDLIMSDGLSSPSSRPFSETSSTSRPQSQYATQSSTISAPSAYSTPTFSDRFQRDCNTCITMMETFQTIYPHPHNISPTQSRSPHPGQMPAQYTLQPPSAVAEMPDPSVYQHRPVPQGTGLVLEAPDTGAYQREVTSNAPAIASGPEPIELPVEMPAQDLRELMRADTVASRHVGSDTSPAERSESSSDISNQRRQT